MLLVTDFFCSILTCKSRLYNSSPAAASSSVVVEESLIPDVAANVNPLKISPHKTAEYKKNKTVCLSHCSSRAQKKKPHEANRTKPNQTNRQTKEHSYNNAVHKALLRLMQMCLTTKLTKARGVTKHMRSECRQPPPPWNQAHRRSTTSSFKPKSLRYLLLELRAHQRSSFAAATDKRKRQVHHNNTSSSPLYFILTLSLGLCLSLSVSSSFRNSACVLGDGG